MDRIVEAAVHAFDGMTTAVLARGRGEAPFGVNRRVIEKDSCAIGVNPDGPIDPSVPVLTVSSLDDKVRIVLFGYACHCTILDGA
jgi:hypothetical protein